MRSVGARPRAKAARGLVTAVCALGLVIASCGDTGSSQKNAAPPPKKSVAAKPQYAEELQKLDAAIAHGATVAAKQPAESLIALELVSLTLERAQLTGDYANYRRAHALLEAVPVAAKKSAAYCLVTAKLHFTLHRLTRAEDALRTCASPIDSVELVTLQADLNFYRGRYRDAERQYRVLVNQLGQSTHFARLANYRAKTGAPAEASALLEAAETRYRGGSPMMQSWFKLQRGLIAFSRGRFDEALALYRLADDALQGWWLVDEHIAEVLALQGKVSEAKAIYAKVIEKTSAPEFMDALAKLERDVGNTAAAESLHQQARVIYQARLTEFPEAAVGHALDHFLESPADAGMALKLARANFAARPFGDAAISLATAEISSGSAARAVALLEQQRSAGWESAELHWALAKALLALRKPQEAAAAQSRALLQNPRSAEMFGPL